MNIPIYNIIINEGDETGCTAISLVDNPAVELPFLCFDKETSLFKADNDKHIISGIAILADTPIYRCSPSRGEYYVVFSKETIRQIVQKYAKNQQFNVVNLQHNDDTFVNTIHMVESLIIDKERGLCPVEFSDVPDGSWYVSYHVEDEALWNEIKNTNHLNGFSIELLSELELKFETNKDIDIMNKFFKLAKAVLELEEVKTDKETLVIKGEIEIGKPVFVETEEGPIPAEDGEYKLEDETIIVVVEGLVAEIRPVEKPAEELPVEEPVKEEELEEEVLPVEDDKTAELEAKIAELEAEIETKDARIAELEAKIAEQEEKLKMSVEEPITKKVINRENKALKYFE